MHRNHTRADCVFKQSTEPLGNEESPKVLGELKKPLLLAQVREDISGPILFGESGGELNEVFRQASYPL